MNLGLLVLFKRLDEWFEDFYQCFFDLVAGLFPGDVLAEGCGEGGELLVGERRLCAGDATIFPVALRILLAI